MNGLYDEPTTLMRRCRSTVTGAIFDQVVKLCDMLVEVVIKTFIRRLGGLELFRVCTCKVGR